MSGTKWTFLLIALGVGGIFSLASLRNPSTGDAPRPAPLPELPPPPPPPLREKVQLTINSWQKGGFDNVGLVDITLKSSATFPLKDAVIVCDFKGESGTVINQRRLKVFKKLLPGEALRERKLNFGIINTQANRLACLVEDVSPA